MRTVFFALTLYFVSIYSALAAPLDISYTHTAAFAVPEQSFDVATTWFLPDWQAGGDVAEKIYKNPHRLSDDSGSGDRQDFTCSTYGLADSCPAPKIYKAKLSPRQGISCYQGCRCPETVTPQTGEHCTETCDGRCIAKACDPAVSWWDPLTVNCVLTCTSDSSVCIKSECKPRVYPGTGETCYDYCWKVQLTDPEYCVEKKCKNKVEIGVGEKCSETCASAPHICTKKECKSEVNIYAGEECIETCASNTGICTAKQNRPCPAGFDTAVNESNCDTSKGFSLLTDGQSGSQPCRKCKTISCHYDYSTDVTEENCLKKNITEPDYIWTFSSKGYSGGSLCGLCEQKCAEGFSVRYSCANTVTEDKGWIYETKGKIESGPCGRCVEKECPKGYSTSSQCGVGYKAVKSTTYFHGDESCYECVKNASCETGGYKSAMPAGQTCSTVTYQGLTCYTSCHACSCTATSPISGYSMYRDTEPNCSQFYCFNSCKSTETAFKSNNLINDCCPSKATPYQPNCNSSSGSSGFFPSTLVHVEAVASATGSYCCGYICKNGSSIAPTPPACKNYGNNSWNGGWDSM